MPHIFSGGDCGACVLGGALGITPERVYDELKGERSSISHGEMMRMLRVAAMKGFADRFIEEAAEWRSSGWWVMAPWGHSATVESLPWFNYVRMAIDAGYYGLAEVDFSKRGGSERGGPDHWVLICGARTEGVVSGKTLTGEVLVSCSARSTGGRDEWVEAFDFLKNRGGYNLLFVRPAK